MICYLSKILMYLGGKWQWEKVRPLASGLISGAVISLKDKFPLLSEINNEQKTTVARMASSGWRLTFRWWLNESLQSQLRKLTDLLTSFAVK